MCVPRLPIKLWRHWLQRAAAWPKIKRKAANTGGFVFCPAGGKKALQRRLGRKGLPKCSLKGSYFILENRVLVFFKAALKTCSAGTPLSSATRRPT